MLFAEASVEKVKSLSTNSGISDDPSSVRTHWNIVIGWMTSEAFKLKNLSEQVRNDFIRDAEARLQERLAREAEEEARREAEERARQEELQRVREAEAKALADAAAAEAEAKAAAEAEAKAAEEQNALTQGESSTFAPLVLKTLEEFQKEQKEVRARLDQQDTVNANIQNLLTQLLQRMPLPPNP
jgi:translation initiation factor IF-2